jgi:hypothetical protein
VTRLRFSPGSHAYWLSDDNGKRHRVPSVTTLQNLLAKPPLVKWAARMAAEYADDHWASLGALPRSERVSSIAGAADAARNTAAAKGTAIHTWAEELLLGRPVDIPAEYQAQVDGLAKWWQRSGLRPMYTECMVWAPEDELLGLSAYAGTLDVLAQDADGAPWLLDFKTGSWVGGSFAVQLAAYAAAPNLVIDGQDTAMPRVAALGIIHVRPEGTRLHTVPPASRAAAEAQFDILRMLRACEERWLEEQP